VAAVPIASNPPPPQKKMVPWLREGAWSVDAPPARFALNYLLSQEGKSLLACGARAEVVRVRFAGGHSRP
jgi:hypothetical protein